MLEKAAQRLVRTVTLIQFIILGLLVLLLFLGIVNFVFNLFTFLHGYLYLTAKEIHQLLDIVLVLFIVIELFRITLAYAYGKEILQVVFEAGFVAVVRKMVLYEYIDYGIWGAVALAVLLFAIIVAYFLIGKTLKW